MLRSDSWKTEFFSRFIFSVNELIKVMEGISLKNKIFKKKYKNKREIIKYQRCNRNLMHYL